MPAPSFRIGLVGVGDHCLQSHVAPLARIADIVAVTDPDPAAIERVRTVTGTVPAAVPDVWETDVDLVIVANPAQFHLDAVRRAVDTGIPTMVEKPLVTSAWELTELESLLARRDTNLVTTCHPRRFDPPVLWYQDNKTRFADKLGPVVAVNFDFSYHAPSKAGLHTGLLADHVSHETDLVNFLFGRTGATLTRIVDTELRYTVAGLRDDNVAVHFAGTRMLTSRRYPEWMTVRHAGGQVVVDLSNGHVAVRDDNTGEERSERGDPTDYQARFLRLASHLLDVVAGKTVCYLEDADLRFGATVGAVLTEQAHVAVREDGGTK